jgi:hypothetical protein
VNRPLPEVAFNGEQELLVAPEDLFMRNKKIMRKLLTTIKNYVNNLTTGTSLKRIS